MAAPLTVDEFLDLVRKSGVVEEKRLDAYLQKKRAAIPTEPAQAAGVLVQDGLLTHFQAENILQGKWRRFSIGKYKVLEKLGSGGMGQVFLCEHKLMRRRVAVKVLPTAKAKDSSALERFYREARAVAALDHPNIVHAYDIDQDEDLHFLVMEYVDGANFQEIVKKSGPLDVLRACHYIRQAALALQHAHEADLVHRDIKPGNILVDRAGVVKILDMGLARFFHDEDDVLTKKYDENVLGTADYLSPEQALDSHTVDIRADIYSLGATFYFLLTGRAPFEGVNAAQKLLMHQIRQPKALADYRADVPAGVAAIVQKMMAKEVGQRYSTPGEVADALEPFTQEPIAPPPTLEMPSLSPAATGQGPALDGGDTAVTKNPTPLSPARTLPHSGSSKRIPAPPRPTAPTPRPTPAAVTAAPVMAPPTAPRAPVEAREMPPWEQTDVDTEDPSAQADTQPHSGRSHRRLQSGRGNSTFLIILVAGFIIIPVLLTGLIAMVIWLYFPPPAPPPPPAGPMILEVSKDPARKGAYRSVQLAMRNAKVGCIIELWDTIHEENLTIDSSKGPVDVTLKAASGREILWKSAKIDDADLPLIKLTKAPNFKLRGKGILLDGKLDAKRRVNDLMLISSDCRGMIVEDLQFKSFARSAILVMNANGMAEGPIKLHGLTTMTDKTEKPRAAIYFDANSKMNPPVNEHIEIRDCEFQGIDLKKAIQFRDNKVLGNNVSWPGR